MKPKKPSQPKPSRKGQGKKQPSASLPPHIPGQGETESGQPGGGVGRIDITGVVPDVIEVDPDLTEGHPGYEDSGDSGLHPQSEKGSGD
jgi:hypothetical protein